jgi:hypothetical protein
MTSRPVVLLRAPPVSVTIFLEFTTYAENRRLWVNRVGLTMSELCPLSPDSDRIADIAACLKGAKMRHWRTMPHRRADEQLRKIGDVSAAMYWSAADPTEYRSS